MAWSSNSSRELVQETLKAAYIPGYRDHVALWRTVITEDHFLFLKIGIPAIDLIEIKYGFEPGLNNH